MKSRLFVQAHCEAHYFISLTRVMSQIFSVSDDDTESENQVSSSSSDVRRFIEDEAGDGGRNVRTGSNAGRKSVKRFAGNHLRRWVLVTLAHCETRDITIEQAAGRILGLFEVTKMCAATEDHADGGRHFHIAFENTNASRNTCTKLLRSSFKEFDGRQFDCRFHKCWVTMLQYVTKEDTEMRRCIFYGDGYGREAAIDDLRSRLSKTSAAVGAIREHVKSGGSIITLVNNDDVAPFMLRGASSVIKFAEMVQAVHNTESSQDAIRRVGAAGDAAACKASLSEAQFVALETFAKQLNGRCLREPQLYCLGPTGTGKTYMWELLASCTRCFIPCLENAERAFAGYQDESFDWILINDFHDNVKFQLLSNLCEGSSMRLNGYGGQVMKKKNIPIVFTANEQVNYKNLSKARVDALKNRLKVVEFQTTFNYGQEIALENLCSLLMSLF